MESYLSNSSFVMSRFIDQKYRLNHSDIKIYWPKKPWIRKLRQISSLYKDADFKKRKKSHVINNTLKFHLVSGYACPQGSIIRNGTIYHSDIRYTVFIQKHGNAFFKSLKKVCLYCLLYNQKTFINSPSQILDKRFLNTMLFRNNKALIVQTF